MERVQIVLEESAVEELATKTDAQLKRFLNRLRLRQNADLRKVRRYGIILGEALADFDEKKVAKHSKVASVRRPRTRVAIDKASKKR